MEVCLRGWLQHGLATDYRRKEYLKQAVTHYCGVRRRENKQMEFNPSHNSNGLRGSIAFSSRGRRDDIVERPTRGITFFSCQHGDDKDQEMTYY